MFNGSPGGPNVGAQALPSKDHGISSVKQSFLCQAVTTDVYVDMQNSEKKAKNVIISGLEETDTQADRDLANNFFSDEFGEQPNIGYDMMFWWLNLPSLSYRFLFCSGLFLFLMVGLSRFNMHHLLAHPYRHV